MTGSERFNDSVLGRKIAKGGCAVVSEQAETVSARSCGGRGQLDSVCSGPSGQCNATPSGQSDVAICFSKGPFGAALEAITNLGLPGRSPLRCSSLISSKRSIAPEMREEHRKGARRSEEHTSELQSLMRISYAGFCLKKKHKKSNKQQSQ